MLFWHRGFPVMFVCLLCTLVLAVVSSGMPTVKPRYRDADLPVDVRVEDLLARMTLAEKVGQLNVSLVRHPDFGKTKEQQKKGAEKWVTGELVEGIGPAGGFFGMPNNLRLEGPRREAEFLNHLQKLAVEETRLGIPLLQVEEGTHGLMCAGGTIFPEGPALGSTWDMDLIRRVYAAAAVEGRAIGVHGLNTLVIEPIRDPRLGRNQEAYSEDSYLSSAIAREIVRGTQGDNVALPDHLAAFLCHFPGQSQPHAGVERGAMEISERMLREVFLPPWETGIKEMGALGVMATYPAIDGVPAHGSREIMTDILRGELGFEGIVVCEGEGLSTLVYERVAAGQKQAGEQALEAGVDVSIWYEDGFKELMLENVAEGRVSTADIDRSVKRLLKLKFELGLFENPYVDPERADRLIHKEEHQHLALEAARKGIVLLKNEGGLLPLDKNLARIAVIGPNADHERNQLGDYVAAVVTQDIITVREGIEGAVSSQIEVEYVKGCEVIGAEYNEIDKAAAAARNAEVAVVVLGENEWQAEDGKGTAGEGYDAATLELTGLQQDLVKAVYDTGTPVVLVLINGRPLAIRWCAEKIPAIVEAWIPGEKGGHAVADILFGNYNPSGKLTVTFPRHAGQLPVYYDARPAKSYWIEEGWGTAYADMNPEPLYPFGFGLSYTSFKYSDLRIEPAITGTDGSVRVSFEVENTGNRKGAEVAQLYLHDKLASVSIPEIRLKNFQRVVLAPGETKTVEMVLRSEDLSIFDRHLQKVVELGVFEVRIGSSSRDIRLTSQFEIIE